ncbi:39S ribosomal protein L42, mitochondrial-like [Marmota marmota marmota]|uniref:39S ribosomal protein L42, mitochondrial-like n=1 Tax=Marmota marmota marmota TaxID=9994 RepID=UPI0020929A49|nr:39S ribosomal protein L42, mitochondrial-like [Marmota marmota marmota]
MDPQRESFLAPTWTKQAGAQGAFERQGKNIFHHHLIITLIALKWVISKRTLLKHLFPGQNGALSGICHKSTFSSLPDNSNCKIELALTSDGRTIVCYHPSVDIPYEHTQLIPLPDPVHNDGETHDQVLKTTLEGKAEHLEQGFMIEKLRKMFFITKHRWYPQGQSYRYYKNLNSPKDR